MKKIRQHLLVLPALALLASACAPRSEAPPSEGTWTPTTLADRAMIEDLLVDYYAQLGSGRHDFGAFFEPDGVIDVNGTVAQGQEAIEEVYRKAAEANPPQPGVFRMVLTNLRVTVNGDTATADAIWTGIHSADVYSTPQLVEQGRESDQLVKRDGRWYFKHRVITSDGGLDPDSFFARTYQPR
jgi:uncharacterized protein (TIGR02246 family)